MNEEDIVKGVEGMLKAGGTLSAGFDYGEEKYLQGLLDLYNKEKEKVKRYKNELDLDFVDENFVSKDKIKAKIEPVLKQLERKMEEEYNKYGNSREYQDVVDAYNFLQSLLEKE